MDEKREKQNHKVTLFAILLSLVSIGVLVFGFSVVSSDKVVMMQSISNLYNKVSNSFQDEFVLFDKIASSNKVGINTKSVLTLGKDKYNLNFSYLENNDDELSMLDSSITRGADSLTTNLVFDKNHKYFSIKDIITNYNYYEDENYSYTRIFKSLSQSDYEKLLSLFKEIINDEIDADAIKKEKVVINYDGKDKKVTKLTYDITLERFTAMFTKLTTSIMKDKALYKNISNLLGKENLSVSIKDYVEMLKDSIDGNVLSYSTYYYGFNKIIEYEIHSYINNMTLNYKEDSNKETINIMKDENTILNIIIGEDKNSYTFNGNFTSIIKNGKCPYNELLCNDFTGSYKDNSLELNISTDVPLKIKFIYNKGTLDTAYRYNTKLDVFNIVDEEEKKVFTMESEIEFVFDKKIDVDLGSATLMSNDSLEEKVMYETLNNNPIYQIIKDSISFINSTKID